MVHPKAKSIREKKLGVLLRDARHAAGKTMKETAEALGISSSTYSSYERGVKSPSLPELEILALFFDVPLDHFWGSEALSEKPSPAEQLDVESVIAARQQTIGAGVKSIRSESGLSIKELAEQTDMYPGRLSAYESGDKPIPLPELEALLSALNTPVEHFMAQEGPVSSWTSRQNSVQDFLELSPEMREFVCKPINRPFLELAQRLSELPTEKLRSVAEGLLEITL